MSKRKKPENRHKMGKGSTESKPSAAIPVFQAPTPNNSVANALLSNARQQNTPMATLDPVMAAEHAQRNGRLKEAEATYKDILKRQPNHVRALTLYGICLNQREKFPEAVRVLRKSIKLDPRQEEAFNGLGTAFKAMERFDDAIGAFEKALEINPGFAGVYNNMGIAYREAGNFDKAAECFEQALEIDADIPEAWNGLARTKRFTKPPENLNSLVELAQSTGMSSLAKKHAWFALGKIYDDLGRYDDAFPCYQKGNDQRLVPAEAHLSCSFMQDMADFFTTERIETLPKASVRSDDPTPVFVIGMPRSGTTLVEQIIASHPQAIGGGELNYFTIEARKRGLDLKNGKTDTFFQNLERMTEKDLKKIQKGFYKNFKPHKNTQVLIDKTPFNFLYVGLIAMALPEARFVHCMRDPLDTGLSIFFTDFAKNQPFSTDLMTIGAYMKGYQTLMAHWQDVQAASILDVDYEQLIEDQDAVTRNLISFCGLPWNDRCLSFHETQRLVSTPSDWQVRQPIYQGSKGRWRNYERYLAPLREGLT